MTPEVPIWNGGQRLLRWSLGVTAIGILGLAIGAAIEPLQFFHAYLFAWATAVSIAVAAQIFLLVVHVMRAGWPVLVRRLCEAIMAPLPLLFVLSAPLFFGLAELYPWVLPEAIADETERALVLHKRPYLNIPFFAVRMVVYFAIWIAVGHLLRRWSVRRDTDPLASHGPRLRTLSAAALPPVALALSFGSFDWLMSLMPEWSSTMFPVYFFAGGFLAALSLLTVMTYAADRAGALPGVTGSHYYALGRLLLAFTIFWAYAAYFQLMLTWIANRPDEAIFYLARFERPWGAVTVILAFVQFVIPFSLLLGYRLKWRPRELTAVAAWLVFAHCLDVHWLVTPTVRQGLFPFRWVDLAALLAVGGASVAFGTYRLRGLPLCPVNDPELPRALAYESR